MAAGICFGEGPMDENRLTRLAEKQQRNDARKERFLGDNEWRHADISKRRYPDYDAYVAHQGSKLELMRPHLQSNFDVIVADFRTRFQALPLKPASSVLCLGARLGHEVAAFISLGHFAVGIDLNPGANNKYVTVGDFHSLVQADRSVDCAYINSIDHVFSLERFCSQIKRVLKNDGFLAADIIQGYEEGFWAGEYETIHWPTARAFADKLAAVGGFPVELFRPMTPSFNLQFFQCVFRPAAGPCDGGG